MNHETDRVHIDLGQRSYDILIGSGLIGCADSFSTLEPGGTAVVVTNHTVGPLLARQLVDALKSRFATVRVIELPDGEAHKHWQVLNTIFDSLLAAGCDRRTVLFALGGGVVGDMTGFAAACYMRGVAYVQVPTTLLAQVDSSVGGKTAINHPTGKNMIGAFHQPLLVVADLDALDTLPDRELVAGLAEVIKYGPIADEPFFGWIETHLEAMLSRDKVALALAVRRSCEIKAQVVSSDEREAGLREILNFGHTFAHAIEAGLGFGTWLHGEAVGCGMVMAASLSARLGLIDDAYAQRIRTVVRGAGLPVVAPDLGVHRYLELMRSDKKARSGGMRFVVIEAPGRAGVRRVDDDVVRHVIRDHVA